MGRNSVIASVSCFSLVLVSGCAPITIPVPVSLTDAGVGEFPVTAGVPENAKANFAFALGRAGGSGRLSIDPANVSVQATNTTGGKVAALNLQDQNVCTDVCLLAEIDASACSAVCTDGDLLITIWIGTQEAIAADARVATPTCSRLSLIAMETRRRFP